MAAAEDAVAGGDAAGGPDAGAAETALAIVARLDLAPHPEGGWYRETWRAPPPEGGTRSAGTAILFLLEAGQRSHWHRVDAAEQWLWHAGSPLTLRIAAADAAGGGVAGGGASGDRAAAETIRLGGDVLVGETPQALVPPGHWQAAEADRGWALVGCVVVPGFEFDGFELAEPTADFA